MKKNSKKKPEAKEHGNLGDKGKVLTLLDTILKPTPEEEDRILQYFGGTPTHIKIQGTGSGDRDDEDYESPDITVEASKALRAKLKNMDDYRKVGPPRRDKDPTSA